LPPDVIKILKKYHVKNACINVTKGAKTSIKSCKISNVQEMKGQISIIVNSKGIGHNSLFE
jgi:hypothetical protein